MVATLTAVTEKASTWCKRGSAGGGRRIVLCGEYDIRSERAWLGDVDSGPASCSLLQVIPAIPGHGPVIVCSNRPRMNFFFSAAQTSNSFAISPSTTPSRCRALPMAPQPALVALPTLRAASFRLTSTPTELLPQSIRYIAHSVAACEPLLSADLGASKDLADAAVAVHKFRTQLSTLLQDRSVHARWAAVVLVKTAVEVGGWETLHRCGPWVRGLLGILTKPDPTATKKLCIITLTRIFVLTRDYPTLVREITTPSLTPFITSCLNGVSPKTLSHIGLQTPAQRELLPIVLESFSLLLPRHSTTFRSYRNQIRQLIDQCVAPTPSSLWRQDKSCERAGPVSPEISRIVRKLYVQLHHCAQKNTAADEWALCLEQSIKYAHFVCDKIFRGVVEDWVSTAGVRSSISNARFEEAVQELDVNGLGLPSWSSVYAGSERLIGTLKIIKQLMVTPTAAPVNVRLGSLLDLLSRILALTVPTGSIKNAQDGVRANSQISNEERETLWIVLPSIHVAALDLFSVSVSQFSTAALSIASSFLDQIIWAFDAEKSIMPVRMAIYSALSRLLQIIGPSIKKSTVQSLRPSLRQCCRDLLPVELAPTSTTPNEKASTNGVKKPTVNLDISLNTSKPVTVSSSTPIGIEDSPYDLLTVFLTQVPAHLIPHPLRAEIDRVAVLLVRKDVMLASVMNPVTSQRSGKPTPSILPLLARSYADDLAVEALVRPRMPVIRASLESTLDISRRFDVEGEDNDAEEEAEEEDKQMQDDETNDSANDLSRPTVAWTGSSTIGHVHEQDMDARVIGDQASVSTSEGANLKRVPSASTFDRPESPKRARFDTLDTKVTVSVAPAAEGHVLQQPVVLNTPVEINTSIAEPTPVTSRSVVAPSVQSDALPASKNALATGEESDDDDDDFGELVIGVDSDEESE